MISGSRWYSYSEVLLYFWSMDLDIVRWWRPTFRLIVIMAIGVVARTRIRHVTEATMKTAIIASLTSFYSHSHAFHKPKRSIFRAERARKWLKVEFLDTQRVAHRYWTVIGRSFDCDDLEDFRTSENMQLPWDFTKADQVQLLCRPVLWVWPRRRKL